MVDLTLRPMTAGELTARLTESIEGFAESLATSNGMPLAQARVESARRTNELLPHGVDTEDMLLWTAEAGGRPVGWIWVKLPGGNRPGMAWVYMVGVDEAERGKGYGRAVMLAAEAELVRRGVPRLGLNVFGHNASAIRLYESLGYHVTEQQMAKPLI
jgi:ribosomal protein S18 acetylase RimI-like enzyme